MTLNRYGQHWRDQPYRGIASVVMCREELGPLLQPIFRESAISRLVELTAHRHPLTRVVDLGCGDGDWTVRYAAFASRVVGIDINPTFIEEARRLAAQSGHGNDIELKVIPIADYDDYENASLVCMAACAMYLEDDQLTKVADRVASAQQPGDFFYLRATVVNRLRRPHQNEFGVYRSPASYQSLFVERGYRVRERMFTAAYVPIFLVRQGLGIRSFTAARVLTVGVAGLLRLDRMTKSTDFCSWLFEKR